MKSAIILMSGSYTLVALVACIRDPGAVQSAVHRCYRDVKPLRNLAGSPVQHIREDQDGSPTGREQLQGGEEGQATAQDVANLESLAKVRSMVYEVEEIWESVRRYTTSFVSSFPFCKVGEKTLLARFLTSRGLPKDFSNSIVPCKPESLWKSLLTEQKYTLFLLLRLFFAGSVLVVIGG